VDKLLAGQIVRGIMWGIALIAVKYGIEVKDTSWVGGLAAALAGGLIAAVSLLWTRYRARALLMTDPPLVKPPLTDLTGGLKTPILILLMLLPLAAGCMGGHDFQAGAPIHGSQVMAQLGVGTEEYHTAETLLFDQAEAGAGDNLKAQLAEYVLKIAKAGGTGTLEDAKKAIEPAFVTFQQEKTKIDGDRRSEATRYRNMLELLNFGKRIFAQIAEIETLRYATYDQLRQMSKEFINQQISTAGKAPATGGAK
jgi:hypothetical protein